MGANTLDFIVKTIKEIFDFICDFLANLQIFGEGFNKVFEYEYSDSDKYQPNPNAV